MNKHEHMLLCDIVDKAAYVLGLKGRWYVDCELYEKLGVIIEFQSGSGYNIRRCIDRRYALHGEGIYEAVKSIKEDVEHAEGNAKKDAFTNLCKKQTVTELMNYERVFNNCFGGVLASRESELVYTNNVVRAVSSILMPPSFINILRNEIKEWCGGVLDKLRKEFALSKEFSTCCSSR